MCILRGAAPRSQTTPSETNPRIVNLVFSTTIKLALIRSLSLKVYLETLPGAVLLAVHDDAKLQPTQVALHSNTILEFTEELAAFGIVPLGQLVVLYDAGPVHCVLFNNSLVFGAAGCRRGFCSENDHWRLHHVIQKVSVHNVVELLLYRLVIVDVLTLCLISTERQLNTSDAHLVKEPAHLIDSLENAFRLVPLFIILVMLVFDKVGAALDPIA